MRYLGIDYGDKRVGTAVSDPEGKIAFPLTQLPATNFRQLVKSIKELVKKEGVERIVVGLPVTFGGGDSQQTKAVKEFVKNLKKVIELPTEYENEVLTTRIVKRSGVRKEHRDQAAAAVILQAYLDKKSETRNPKS